MIAYFANSPTTVLSYLLLSKHKSAYVGLIPHTLEGVSVGSNNCRHLILSRVYHVKTRA